MGYKYDTQTIYGDTKASKDSFMWNGALYYTTKTGRCKKKEGNGKPESLIWAEYEYAWDKYRESFGI